MGVGKDQGGNDPNPYTRSSFNSFWSQPEGKIPAQVIEGVIVGVDLKTWTVDVMSKYDKVFFSDIPVGSPYLHPNSGEGIYVVPEIGAKCYTCVPSDGPPAFLLCFIMPVEQADVPDVPEGDVVSADSYAETSIGYLTYAGGRTRPKPGDIIMRGRDGNFIALHRGGVLQIGSTELSQRLYIPLQNLITDISQNYRHHNVGGTLSWGVQMGSPDTAIPTCCKQTMRLFADQEKATIRISKGTFEQMGESSDGWQEDLSELEIGSEPVIYEVAISPEGFNADDAAVASGGLDGTKLRFLVDKEGGTFLGARGSVLLGTKGKLRIVAEDDIYIESKKSITIKAGTTLRIEGGDAMDLSAKVTKLNGGSKPIAHVGSMVTITVTVPVPIVVGGVAGTIVAGSTFTGMVSTGNPTGHI